MNKESAMESFFVFKSISPIISLFMVETILLTFQETQQQFLNHKMDHSLQ
jgi:hypothetical protein